jgi:histidine triad (HIT) family protein
MVKKDCIFCGIISGEISTEKVYDGKNFIVIKDANPQTNGHSLVIPKKHCNDFLNLDKKYYLEFLETVKFVTPKILEQIGATDFNLLVNDGKHAGQVVGHLHMHIIPRFKNDGFKF